MPKCPECGGSYRQRSGGTCPGCSAEVFLYREKGKTIWVTEAPSTKKLVKKLERHLRGELPAFTFGNWKDDSYRRELAMAKALLEKCDNSQELAEKVVDTYFADERLYPPKSMAGVIGKQLPYALAKAKKMMKIAEIKEKAAKERARQGADLDVRYSL